jgi:hypothetical protein
MPAEYAAGLARAIERGWLWKHESGIYVKLTQAGAELFTYETLEQLAHFERIAWGLKAISSARNADANGQPTAGMFDC